MKNNISNTAETKQKVTARRKHTRQYTRAIFENLSKVLGKVKVTRECRVVLLDIWEITKDYVAERGSYQPNHCSVCSEHLPKLMEDIEYDIIEVIKENDKLLDETE